MSNDITRLLYTLREGIRSKHPDLDTLRADFLELLELCKLFLISERDSYYGYFLMNMQFKPDFYSDTIAGIRLDAFPPVLVSNPVLLCRFSIKEILFILCHEIDHVVLNHPAEMLRVNPNNIPELFELFNIAADAAVNDRLNYEIENEKHYFMKIPKGAVTSASVGELIHDDVDERESYAYYWELLKRALPTPPPNAAQQMMAALEDGDDSGEQSDNPSGSGNQSDEKQDGQNQSGGNQGDDENDGQAQSGGNQGDDGNEGSTQSRDQLTAPGSLSDHQWGGSEDAEDLEAATREFVNRAVDIMSEETRGMMPASFMEQVKRLNEPPKLQWQKILKKYVGTISVGKRRTRTRLNRRQPERFDLSGRMDDKIIKIIVAIDTSGSVDNHMISQIMNEIFAILAKRRHEVTILECDAEVQRVYRVRSAADVQEKVAGRGGTWFTPAIEYINEHKEFRDALLIYFTDGYGEDEIPKPRTYRNIWVVLGVAANLSVREPYGIVLEMDYD